MRNRELELTARLEALTLETREVVTELRNIQANNATDEPSESQTDRNQVDPSKRSLPTRPKQRKETPFHIGDKVRVKNPSTGQASLGTITRIGKIYLTITDSTGRKINRIPRNVSKLTSPNSV